jgi:transcriptional regulator GlxA family with amidase domain
MIRQDDGSSVAADAARIAVMLLERDGGQAQFIVHAQPTPTGATLEPLLRRDGRNRMSAMFMEFVRRFRLCCLSLAAHLRLAVERFFSKPCHIIADTCYTLTAQPSL